MELVDTDIQGGVFEITIRREAQLNALNSGVLSELRDAIHDARALCRGPNAFHQARVLVIRGAGEKAFVAGADIQEMKAASRQDLLRFITLGQTVMREIEALPLPSIAVVQGYALGGGLELALACDLIVAGERGLFGQPEVSLGLIPGFGGTQRLIHRIGIGSTRRLVLTGENIGAQEALRLGLVDWVVPQGELDTKVSDLVKLFKSRGPRAIESGKRAIARGVQALLAAGLQSEVDEFLGVAASTDAEEGLSAFLEKRKPIFPGQ